MFAKNIAFRHCDISLSKYLDLSIQTRLGVISADQALLSLSDCDFLKTVTSGDSWTTHGGACRVDIYMLVDEPLLYHINNIQILRSVAEHVEKAPAWTLLNFSPRATWQFDQQLNRHYISICINDSISKTGQYSHASDVHTPRALPVVIVESLQLHLKIVRRWNPQRMEKATLDTVQTGADSPMPILFDQPSGEQNGSGIRVKERGRFTTQVTEVLLAWYNDNESKPYPSIDEKRELQTQTGLGRQQLNRWFQQRRSNRHLVCARGEFDEMLLSPGGGLDMPKYFAEPRVLEAEELCHFENYVGRDDEMLLMSIDENVSSLSSPSTCPSAVSFAASSSSSVPLFQEGLESFILNDQEIMLGVTQLAKNFQTTMTGYSRSHDGLRGDDILMLPLSAVIPEMLSPGFKTAMGQNARFLPTISSAITISMARNAQSPSLKSKLSAMEQQNPTSINQCSPNTMQHQLRENLPDLVQSKLWAILHRKLYDPKASRKLDFTSNDVGSHESTMPKDNEEHRMLLDGDNYNTGIIADSSQELTATDESDDLLAFISDEFRDNEDDETLEDALSEADSGLLLSLGAGHPSPQQESDCEMLLGEGHDHLEIIEYMLEDEMLLI